MEVKTVQQSLMSCNQAEVVIDNEIYQIDDTKNLNKVLNIMLENSIVMPAYSVSLHNETINAMQNGVWLKLSYGQTCWVGEMPFDNLLIQVEPSWSGFNVMRGNEGKYEGRCYYINLADTMQSLYKYLIEFKQN